MRDDFEATTAPGVPFTPGVTGGTFDFWRKSTPFSSRGAVVKLRQTAIRIGDTSSLSLISILSEIVQEISTGSFEGEIREWDLEGE